MQKRTTVLLITFALAALVAIPFISANVVDPSTASLPEVDGVYGYDVTGPTLIPESEFLEYEIFGCGLDPRAKGAGLIGRTTPLGSGFRAGANGQCVPFSVLNSNLANIFELNPEMTTAERKAISDKLQEEINKCIERVNNPSGSSGFVIDPSVGGFITPGNGISPHGTAGGEFSDEFKAFMKCKNEAMDALRKAEEAKPVNDRLVIPDPEGIFNIYKRSRATGTVFYGADDWCEKLKLLLEAGGGATINVLGGNAAQNHAFTITEVTCTPPPPKLKMVDPINGLPVTALVSEDPDTHHLTLSGTQGSDLGLGSGGEVISIIGITPSTPTPAPGGTTSGGSGL